MPPSEPAANHPDLIVIGAGPAGMSAAVAAADAGCTVTVVDLGARPGGQYWRWGPATEDGRYHHGWAAFTALADRYRRHQDTGHIGHRSGHAVFAIEPPPGGPDGVSDDQHTAHFTVHAVADDRLRQAATVHAPRVLVATGAYDRQLPIPGWTLPGVMAAGAAQSLLKGSGVPPGHQVVVAGTGPFLLPVAAGLVQAGAKVVAVAEAADPTDYLRSARSLAASWRKLPEAATYLQILTRHRVPLLRRHAAVAAEGDGRLQRVTLARVDRDWRVITGSGRDVEADVLAAGYGFLPQVELLAESGARLRPDGDGSLVAAVDTQQQTSIPGLYAAGETTGVGGADLACLEGTAAGAAVAASLGRAVTRPKATDLHRMAAFRRFAAVMHDVHAIGPGWTGWPTPATIICRCEEITLSDIRFAQELGAADTRTVKLLARPGMGWCQGRMCAPAVGALLGEHAPPIRPGDYPAARRPLAQPVPLRILADLAGDGNEGV